MNKKVFECIGVSKSYQDGDNETAVLKDLSLSLEQGETLAIVGSSGSGKSTLLHILGTLDQASQGKVKLLGQDVHQFSRKKQADFRNQHLGFIYQFHHLLMEFTALENAAMPLLIAGMNKAKAFPKAKTMLEKVGLSHRLDHKPAQLSGGERQRVAIARALVSEPELVLADEPTGNLDKDNAHKIYELICQLNESSNTSFVVVTHDMTLASKLDKQVHLVAGNVVAGEQV